MPLAHVAHQPRDLAAAAEQHQDDRASTISQCQMLKLPIEPVSLP
jgi:hypothetical protein